VKVKKKKRSAQMNGKRGTPGLLGKKNQHQGGRRENIVKKGRRPEDPREDVRIRRGGWHGIRREAIKGDGPRRIRTGQKLRKGIRRKKRTWDWRWGKGGEWTTIQRRGYSHAVVFSGGDSHVFREKSTGGFNSGGAEGSMGRGQKRGKKKEQSDCCAGNIRVLGSTALGSSLAERDQGGGMSHLRGREKRRRKKVEGEWFFKKVFNHKNFCKGGHIQHLPRGGIQARDRGDTGGVSEGNRLSWGNNYCRRKIIPWGWGDSKGEGTKDMRKGENV